MSHNLLKCHKKAQKIADPMESDEFKDLALSLRLEEFIGRKRAALDVPAHQYAELKEFLSADLFSVLKEDNSTDLNSLDFDFETNNSNSLLEKLGIDENGTLVDSGREEDHE